MKKKFKALARRLLTKDIVWRPLELILGSLSGTYAFLKAARAAEFNAEKLQALTSKLDRILPDLEVLNGPFQGMRYPSRASVGSAFYPKILGTYEHELDRHITYIAAQPYSAIVNVGCAEGYYAVGLGMLCRGSRIYAFDTNAKAISLCRAMAELNHVDITFGGTCEKSTLLQMELGRRALILCDCEGYENRLLDEEVSQKLSDHDFLIETHDFIDIETTRRLYDIFKKTHDCEITESLDDILKAYTYEFDELKDLTLDERLHVLREGRPAIMRWIFAKSRTRTRE